MLKRTNQLIKGRWDDVNKTNIGKLQSRPFHNVQTLTGSEYSKSSSKPGLRSESEYSDTESELEQSFSELLNEGLSIGSAAKARFP